MPSRKRNRRDSQSKQYRRPFKQILLDAVRELEKRDRNKIFHEPVDKEEVPAYYEIIKNPMDFSTMRKKLSEGKYRSWSDFEHDFKLIVDNCTTFNPQGTIWYRAAQTLARHSKKIFDECKAEMALERPPPPSSTPSSTTHTSATTPGTDERKQRRRYVRSGLHRSQPEASGGLLVQDLGMRATPTPMDLMTIWRREQTLQEAGARPFLLRQGHSLQECQIGPLFFSEFRPFREKPFVQQYNYRMMKFVNGMPKRMLERARVKSEMAQGLLPENYKSFWKPPEHIMEDARKYGLDVANGTPSFLEKKKNLGTDSKEIVVFGVKGKDLEKLKGLTTESNTVIVKMLQAAENIAELRKKREREAAEARLRAEQIARERAAKAAKAAKEAEAARKKKELARKKAAAAAAAAASRLAKQQQAQARAAQAAESHLQSQLQQYAQQHGITVEQAQIIWQQQRMQLRLGMPNFGQNSQNHQSKINSDSLPKSTPKQQVPQQQGHEQLLEMRRRTQLLRLQMKNLDPTTRKQVETQLQKQMEQMKQMQMKQMQLKQIQMKQGNPAGQISQGQNATELQQIRLAQYHQLQQQQIQLQQQQQQQQLQQQQLQQQQLQQQQLQQQHLQQQQLQIQQQRQRMQQWMQQWQQLHQMHLRGELNQTQQHYMQRLQGGIQQLQQQLQQTQQMQQMQMQQIQQQQKGPKKQKKKQSKKE
eukprot:CAMPEP_0114501032 /NCGR_PEP_ID=MMETSP0109-20121206/8279_1 /TAXON_ID=29199 /ORGANISM="Chlorarachnion reptans, Strain CCCM449" /LENGTH=702 /DNA_ID=CAMNT_0001678729 /DNA_START=187 /DNA_END=2295 /DNA_ORIENTATION=+